MVVLALEASLSRSADYSESECKLALAEILQVCERSGVGYAIGFACNGVLERKIADLLELARLQCIQTGQKARSFEDVSV